MAELAYSPQGEQAVVRFELPSVEVIPAVDSYTYVATSSTLREKKRPKAEMAQLYRSVVSQITLLYMRDLFESDPELDNVELAGHVRSVNGSTNLSGVGPVHAADLCGRVTAMWLRIRRW
jgi:restriction system protein